MPRAKAKGDGPSRTRDAPAPADPKRPRLVCADFLDGLHAARMGDDVAPAPRKPSKDVEAPR